MKRKKMSSNFQKIGEDDECTLSSEWIKGVNKFIDHRLNEDVAWVYESFKYRKYCEIETVAGYKRYNWCIINEYKVFSISNHLQRQIDRYNTQYLNSLLIDDVIHEIIQYL